MTIRSVGYDGSIGETDWANYLAPYIGSPPMVAGANSFKVSATNGLSVQVAPGVAHGWGVTDVSDAAETIQLDAVTSGYRVDAVVLRREWSGTSTTPSGASTGGRTSIGFVRGGVSGVPSLASSGGNLTEHPLALVKVTAGASTVQVVEDLRVNTARTAWVRSELAMTGPPGTRYALEPDGRRYVRVVDASGNVVTQPEWEPAPPPPPVIPKVASGTVAITTNKYGSATIQHNLGWKPKVVMLTPRLATDSGLVVFYVSAAATGITDRNVNITAKLVTPTGQVPYEGRISDLDWTAIG